MGSKAKAQRIHAKRRAFERFGLVLSNEDLDALVKQIRRGDASHIETQSNTRTIWQVQLNGKSYRVAYDKGTGSIASFLPDYYPTER